MGITGGATGDFPPGVRPNPAAPPTIAQSILHDPSTGEAADRSVLLWPVRSYWVGLEDEAGESVRSPTVEYSHGVRTY